jgi:hypothetical protein
MDTQNNLKELFTIHYSNSTIFYMINCHIPVNAGTAELKLAFSNTKGTA